MMLQNTYSLIQKKDSRLKRFIICFLHTAAFEYFDDKMKSVAITKTIEEEVRNILMFLYQLKNTKT